MPGMAFGIKVVGADKLASKLTSELIRNPLEKQMKKLAKFLGKEISKATIIDEGRLRASITEKAFWNEAIVGTNVTYAPFVEYGTKAHFPPVAPLEAWAHRHGMTPGAGFLVARAISRRGTSPVHMEGARRVKGLGMFGYGFKRLQENIKEFLGNLGAAIELRWNR